MAKRFFFNQYSQSESNAKYTVEIHDAEYTQQAIKYGLLYNWYAATDARNICAEGWDISTEAEFDSFGVTLGGNSVAGGKLKETGFTYFISPNTGATNELNFNGRGASYRDGTTGNFNNSLGLYNYFWSKTEFNLLNARFRYLSYNYTSFDGNGQGIIKKNGCSIRPTRPASESELLQEDGTACAPYIGNDGKSYPTVKIGTQVWLAANLAETKFRNGETIPIVTDNSAWAALTTAGMCTYNNDWDNVYTEIKGTPIEIDGSFTLKYDESNINDFLRALYPSYAELNINVRESDTDFESFLEEIAGADEERFTVRIFRNDEQIWLGQLPTDLVDYPDQYYTYPVTLSAVCGLSRLKNIKYDNNGVPYSGRNTILGHLINCLLKLNYPTMLGYEQILQVSALNWVEDSLVKVTSGIENIDLAYDVFQEYDDFGVIDSMNCYDVLENLCRQFHYRLFMAGDCFMAQQVNDQNAAFVYKHAINGIVLTSDNVDFRKYFTVERTDGRFYNYPPIREITMLYNYKQGINRGNLLPPNYEIGTTVSIGTITGGAGEVIKINIAGSIRVIIVADEAWFVRYHLTLKIGSKYLTGVTSNILSPAPPTWSDTEAFYIIDFGPYISVQTQPFNIELNTPPVDPGGIGTFELAYDDTYENATTPVVLDEGTYAISWNQILCNLLFENDEGAEGKIKFSALNTTDGSTPIKSRFNMELPDTIIGDGPRIYSSGRLRVQNGETWTNSDSWAFASGEDEMNINKLRLQETLAMRRAVTKAFDFTLLEYCQMFHYPILNDEHRMLILGYELDPDMDAVIINTIYYVTNRGNIVINDELDAPKT